MPRVHGVRRRSVANARTKTRTAGAGIQFLRGDAQQIPFPDNSFDLVTISYGLRNLADWQLGLREMQRVAPEYPLATGQIERLPPEPRLQTNPREDLRDLRAQEDAILGSYALVDKDRGVVRIPIDEAMKLIVQRGLPARTQQERPK